MSGNTGFDFINVVTSIDSRYKIVGEHGSKIVLRVPNLSSIIFSYKLYMNSQHEVGIIIILMVSPTIREQSFDLDPLLIKKNYKEKVY